MTTRTASTVSTRPTDSIQPRDARGVRLPAGADSKLFGGWGVRF